MRYGGVVALGPSHLQLVVVEELRDPDPPIRLVASFFEPGSADEMASQLRLWGDELVLALAGPADPEAGERSCDAMLAGLGVPPAPRSDELAALASRLDWLNRFSVEEEGAGTVGDGGYTEAPLIETSSDGVFCALQNRRLPARRHPLGIQMRIEELEAAAGALCAHRYAVGHASWLGGPDGAIVLPGSAPPESFETRGVVPPVERLPLAGS